MIASGMIRKIDLLGRIVIPKEIRKTLKIASGDDIEMFVENDSIILKKYQAMDNYSSLAKSYCQTIYDNIHVNCFICSKEKVIASTSSITREEISKNLIELIDKGENVFLKDDQTIPLFDNDLASKYKCLCISPVKCMGDLYGAVVAFSGKNVFTDEEISLIYNASLFLCGQLL